MKRILLVEDDALIARIYARKLEDAGFRVSLAGDGLTAIKQIPIFKPELVVLDIMLPKLNGVEVLKFLRQQPELKLLPVVVFSNAFLNSLWEQITTLGVQEIMLKSSVTPPQLVQIVQKILSRPAAASPGPTEARAADLTPGKGPKKREPAGALAAAPVLPAKSSLQNESASEFRQRISRDFIEQIPAITAGLHQVCREFLESADVSIQLLRLEDLCRKIGSLTHMTSMTGWYRLAQLSSAFEALLYELPLKPGALNDCVRHTISATVTLLADCLGRSNQADEQCFVPTTVLVVDDDAVSTRALVITLDRARMVTASVSDPFKALEVLRQNSYDVVILDINLPGMSGITLCEEMRKLPLHRDTPVIFITSYTEFEPRARSILNAGDDLIGKPILPIELTVKVIAHMLRRRLAPRTPPR